MKKLYVGNLAYSVTEDDLKELFTSYGEVSSVNIIKDRDTNQSKGFGFVEMDPGAADSAIEALDGNDYNGRNLRVNEARAREERGGGGGRGGYGGGGGGRRGGGGGHGGGGGRGGHGGGGGRSGGGNW